MGLAISRKNHFGRCGALRPLDYRIKTTTAPASAWAVFLCFEVARRIVFFSRQGLWCGQTKPPVDFSTDGSRNPRGLWSPRESFAQPPSPARAGNDPGGTGFSTRWETRMQGHRSSWCGWTAAMKAGSRRRGVGGGERTISKDRGWAYRLRGLRRRRFRGGGQRLPFRL
jgi:hypothetical protein